MARTAAQSMNVWFNSALFVQARATGCLILIQFAGERSGRLLACSAAEKTTEEDENALEGEGASADYNRRTMEGAQLLLEQRAAKAQQGGRRGERRQWSILWPYYLFSRDDGSSRMVSKPKLDLVEDLSSTYYREAADGGAVGISVY
ncbi:hypothetical protein ZEAMMB73_Zm00001d013608 [Zea mays]|uniref:Uncharacterized protein n=1 Tax=Zea mays TaxID=4577 RepID=A0A1D6GKY4_MAIZE|nr:hypothetical protein ZEAMMB73_Zm00001d013608 [Zea mays]